MFKTHLALGFLIGLLSLQLIETNHPIIFVLIITLCTSLPDIDHPKSKIGRRLFFISWPISIFFKHRGFFHSIFPALILFAVLYYFGYAFFAYAVAIGYLAHLIGDAVTREGINFLHPFTTFRIQGPMLTGATLESVIFITLIFLNILYTLKLVMT
jgi:inner membrane protein